MPIRASTSRARSWVRRSPTQELTWRSSGVKRATAPVERTSRPVARRRQWRSASQGFHKHRRRKEQCLPLLPRPGKPAILVWEPARIAKHRLCGLPCRARTRDEETFVGRPLQRAADRRSDEETGAGTVPAVSPDAARAIAALVAHALPRRQGNLHQLPQSPWLAEPAPTPPSYDKRELLQLPHRAPRALPLGAPAGHGRLRELPRTTWHKQPATAQGANAAGVRLLPRHQPPPHGADTPQLHP